MFWRAFKTKAEATKAIQAIINERPFFEPFESELISDLIAEKHYFCSINGFRPTRFRKIPSYGAYSFEGDFSHLEVLPPIGWHPVSWTGCLKPPKSNWDRIVRAMRDRIKPTKLTYRDFHPICEDCGLRASEEAHHKDPSFQEIAEAVRVTVSDREILDCLGNWNWFEKSDFSLPEGHPITLEFDRIHRGARLEALCRPCHNKTKKKG